MIQPLLDEQRRLQDEVNRIKPGRKRKLLHAPPEIDAIMSQDLHIAEILRLLIYDFSGATSQGRERQ